MRVLVHMCCGPCSITVLQGLLDAGHAPDGLFFNPNIQPLAEYMRRREGARLVAERLGRPFTAADALPPAEQDWDDPWLRDRREPAFAPGAGACALPAAASPALWLRAVAQREGERCTFCWRIRLQKTAELALARGYDGFTTTLLYSRHQDHGAIRDLGRSIAAALGTAFVYEDYRASWQEGIALSRAWGIYRQQYCGCLFSEYDRYSREFDRLRKAGEGPRPPAGQ